MHGNYRERVRAPRGDVRAAVLLLLSEQPMHGYQLMHAIAERSGGRWTPSPGAVYPAISMLEDEGLVEVTAASGRKLVTLTPSGRKQAEVIRKSGVGPFSPFDAVQQGPDLRGLLDQLHGAVRAVGRNGSEAQIEATATVLADARRAVYSLLAGDDPGR